MKLWIRSQNRLRLVNAIENITITHGLEPNYQMFVGITYIGEYKTEERALEVLDEIQSKLKATFLMKSKDNKYNKYIVDGKRYLEELNDIEIVTGDGYFELEPINSDVYIYEMPKE